MATSPSAKIALVGISLPSVPNSPRARIAAGVPVLLPTGPNTPRARIAAGVPVLLPGVPNTPRARIAFATKFTQPPLSPRARIAFAGGTDPIVPIFPFPPDWSAPVTERMEWKTSVITSHDGTEQRVSLRHAPRRILEYRIMISRWQLPQFDAILYGWQDKSFDFPLWTDNQWLTTDHAVGATEILVPTTYMDYIGGGYGIGYGELYGGNPLGVTGRAILIESDDGESAYGTQDVFTEIVEIDYVLPDRIVLTGGTGRAWPKGSRILPLKKALISKDVSITRQTDALIEATIAMEITSQELEIGAPDDLVFYLGDDVLDSPQNRRDPVTETVSRAYDRIDSLVGIFQTETRSDHPNISRSRTWTIEGRDEIWNLRRWFHRRKGRFKPFWVATDSNDLDLAQPISSADKFLLVKDAKTHWFYGRNLNDNAPSSTEPYVNPSRRDIEIMKNDGTAIRKRIQQFYKTGTPGVEQIVLDAAVGEDLAATDIRRIMHFGLHRLEQDVIVFRWQTDGMIEVTVNARLL